MMSEAAFSRGLSICLGRKTGHRQFISRPLFFLIQYRQNSDAPIKTVVTQKPSRRMYLVCCKALWVIHLMTSIMLCLYNELSRFEGRRQIWPKPKSLTEPLMCTLSQLYALLLLFTGGSPLF